MRKQWWIPVLVIIFFCVESQFVNFIPSRLFSQYWIIVPRFLFLLLIFITVYYDKKLGLIYALVTGLIMDIVFIDILGIYLFWYPVTIFLVSILMKNWHANLFIVAFVSLLAITFVEFGIYGFFSILQIANMPLKFFVSHRLFPTLGANLAFYILFSYSLKKYFSRLRKIRSEEEGMFQS